MVKPRGIPQAAWQVSLKSEKKCHKEPSITLLPTLPNNLSKHGDIIQYDNLKEWIFSVRGNLLINKTKLLYNFDI